MQNRIDHDSMGPSTNRRNFRAQLLQRMAEKKFTAAALAKRASISKDAVSSYTSMRSLPTEPTLAKIAKALNCKPKDLLAVSNENEMTPVVEIREYNREGYKLLVARVPVPDSMVAELFNQLIAFAKNHKKR